MTEYLTAVVEIAVLSVIFYYVLIFIRSTGSLQALKGIGILGVVVFLAWFFKLEVLYTIFSRSVPYLALAFVVIFQEELRRALSELGRGSFFFTPGEESAVVDELLDALQRLSSRRYGGLIAVSREISLENQVDTGVSLNCPLSSDLLVSIFTPPGPLHDGAVIVEGKMIRAARCLLPFTRRELGVLGGGMRHRAALGMAEQSDAVVLVVSEETGKLSLAFRSKLTYDIGEERLRKVLEGVLVRRQPGRGAGGKS